MKFAQTAVMTIALMALIGLLAACSSSKTPQRREISISGLTWSDIDLRQFRLSWDVNLDGTGNPGSVPGGGQLAECAVYAAAGPAGPWILVGKVLFAGAPQMSIVGDYPEGTVAWYRVVPRDGTGLEPPPGQVELLQKLEADAILTYFSSAAANYAGLGWKLESDQDTAEDWIYQRVRDLVPPGEEISDPTTPEFTYHGPGAEQTLTARVNLTRGNGEMRFESSSYGAEKLSAYSGGPGAFSVMQTADAAQNTPFSEDQLAATPFVVMNADPAMVQIDQFVAGGRDHASEGVVDIIDGVGDPMEGVTTRLGIFFEQDPIAYAADDWKEKWCIIQDTTGSLGGQSLEEY